MSICHSFHLKCHVNMSFISPEMFNHGKVKLKSTVSQHLFPHSFQSKQKYMYILKIPNLCKYTNNFISQTPYFVSYRVYLTDFNVILPLPPPPDPLPLYSSRLRLPYLVMTKYQRCFTNAFKCLC